MALSADWNGRLRLAMIESHVNKSEVILWQLMRKLRESGKIKKLQAKQHQRPDTF